MFSAAKRRSGAALVGLAVISSSLVLFSGAADARVSSAHINATCAAVTPFGPLSQPRAFDLDVNAPLETADASAFTVTIPGGTTTLENKQAGFPATSYSNLYTVYSVTGGTVVAGSALAAGSASYDNGSGPQSTPNVVTEVGTDKVRTETPGPLLTNGHNISLTTPDVTFSVLPNALDTPVFVNGNEAGSDVLLSIGAISATCPLLDTPISKTLIGPSTSTAFSALDTSVQEPASGTTTVKVTVQIVGPAPTKAVKVKYATVDGTATSKGSGKDYAAKKGTLQFRKGVTSRTISIRVAHDSFAETDQHFTVQLSSPSPGVTLRLDNARVDIND